MEATIAPINETFLKHCLTMVSDIVKLPVEHLWIDYDREADVLYLSFRKPQSDNHN